jgi:hypothetical protein
VIGHIELLRIHADIVIAKRLSDGRVPLLLFNIAIEVCRQVLQGKFKIHRKGRRERGKYGHPLEFFTNIDDFDQIFQIYGNAETLPPIDLKMTERHGVLHLAFLLPLHYLEITGSCHSRPKPKELVKFRNIISLLQGLTDEGSKLTSHSLTDIS